jgi:hypothetical protein
MVSEVIEVTCSRRGDDWLAHVTVTDRGSSRQFEVTVTAEELAGLDPDNPEPHDLVLRSFEFLLTREPKESILRSFGLSVISRYFPEYERDIRRG